jgi:transcriptional regulator with XRE-family HTH domain
MVKRHPIRPHLKAWRKKLGKRQTWLANEIGTNPSNIVRQERGEIGVDEATFAAIANAYGITIEELSAHPDQADKARATHRLSQAVQLLDSESVDILRGLAERMIRRDG